MINTPQIINKLASDDAKAGVTSIDVNGDDAACDQMWLAFLDMAWQQAIMGMYVLVVVDTAGVCLNCIAELYSMTKETMDHDPARRLFKHQSGGQIIVTPFDGLKTGVEVNSAAFVWFINVRPSKTIKDIVDVFPHPSSKFRYVRIRQVRGKAPAAQVA